MSTSLPLLIEAEELARQLDRRGHDVDRVLECLERCARSEDREERPPFDRRFPFDDLIAPRRGITELVPEALRNLASRLEA